ncbi:cysteine desulfurase [Enterococcus sp. JM4C]|uniref:DUF1831 domain-containing protein n=1 Tax=Candidatus Enterococcus huntleyi TaxID=1857217 RepID=UPI00137A8366|nr:DUF1831 domain-containing protein [Enterococcus sp. JM4C]KAF1295597.1 cysteine desulfurase [Enterococcus sp. JM4C]
MAFLETATVEGTDVLYKLNPAAKKYTLRDNGFTETKSGNFQLIRPLDATPQSKEGFKLKITVSKDIKTLKMSITTANGLKSVNLFKDEKHKMNQDKFFFLMDGMIDRGLFEKVVK